MTIDDRSTDVQQQLTRASSESCVHRLNAAMPSCLKDFLS